MFIEKTLSNGIRVVIEKLSEIRSVTMGIWVKAGSVNETADTNGISHYIEHMLFKGTEKRSYLDIASEIDNIGGQINAFTGKECTCYYTKVIDEKQSVATDILTDMLCNSVFDQKELDKERGVVIEEINMSNDTPDDVAHEKISEQYFLGTEISKTILGPAENIRRFQKSDITAYMQNFYTTDRIVVVAVGNVDVDQLMEDLEEKLTKVSAKKAGEGSTVPENWQTTPSFLHMEKDIEQMNICIAMPSYTYLHPQKYTVSAVSNILGGSMSSRLFQKIREEMGMAYSVYSYSSLYTGAGSLNIYSGNSPENTEQIIDEIFTILRNFRISPEELENTKSQLKGNYILSQESMSSKMNGIGKNMLLRGSYLTESDILNALNSITMNDVDEAISYMMDMNKLSCVLVGPMKNTENIRAKFIH